MATWTLVPCLYALRRDLDLLAPNRDKTSDGSIGDTAHAAGGSSDHLPDEQFSALRGKDDDQVNEVHAVDVDKDGPWPAGWSMERIVQTVVLRHRTGMDDRLQNCIYNGRIWSRSWGWTAREYTGANRHEHHAHFSARYTAAAENDTRPWGLLEAEGDDDMATISQTDFNARMDAWWNARMSPSAADNPARTALRVAPWQQIVGRTNKSTHAVLFDEMYRMLAQLSAQNPQQLETLRQEVAAAIAAISANPNTSIQLSDAQAGELAQHLLEQLPPAVAAAVNDDASRRLQG